MWTTIAVIYALGLAVTGVTLYRTRMFREAHLVNTGAVVLWPVYWGLYLITLFMNRSRG